MKHLLYASIIFGFVVAAGAQSYNPGLPLPGLPKSLGTKPMSGSTSVTIASDQFPIPISGTISASNPSVGINFVTAPSSSTEIGYIDPSGNLHPFLGNATGITVSANQGTIPWVVSGGVAITNTPSVTFSGGIAITNTPTVNQGTNPWVISGGVALTATPTVDQGTSPWVTSRTWNLSSPVDSVTVAGNITTTAVSVSSSTISRVANNVSSQTLLNLNANRKAVFLFNDSTSTNCYVKFGATASLTSFTIKMFSTDTYIMDPPTYVGVIDYICDAASGSMEVNEQ